MDKYKTLMCIKGLLISLDEQIYRFENRSDKYPPMLQNDCDTLVAKFYNAILEQLGFEDKKIKHIKELYKNKIITHEQKEELLNPKQKEDNNEIPS